MEVRSYLIELSFSIDVESVPFNGGLDDSVVFTSIDCDIAVTLVSCCFMEE